MATVQQSLDIEGSVYIDDKMIGIGTIDPMYVDNGGISIGSTNPMERLHVGNPFYNELPPSPFTGIPHPVAHNHNDSFVQMAPDGFIPMSSNLSTSLVFPNITIAENTDVVFKDDLGEDLLKLKDGKFIIKDLEFSFEQLKELVSDIKNRKKQESIQENIISNITDRIKKRFESIE